MFGRMISNIFISPACTKGLLNFVDESFEDSSAVYYKLNYTMAMQICDGEIVCIRAADGRKIRLVNTDLHRKGEPLYALIEPNQRQKAKQQWQIYQILTVGQLARQHGIYPQDIPHGSNALRNWKRESDEIEISERLIQNYFGSGARIDFYAPPAKNSKGNNVNRRNGVRIRMSRIDFADEACESFRQHQEEEEELLCISQFDKQKKNYHLAKLLPVCLSVGGNTHCVGLLFKFDGKRTIVQGIAIDVKDMRNKANLIQNVTFDSWLHHSNSSAYRPVSNLELFADEYYHGHQQEQPQWERNQLTLNDSVVFGTPLSIENSVSPLSSVSQFSSVSPVSSAFGTPEVTPMPMSPITPMSMPMPMPMIMPINTMSVQPPCPNATQLQDMMSQMVNQIQQHIAILDAQISSMQPHNIRN